MPTATIEQILLEDSYQRVTHVAGGAEVLALFTHVWVDVLLFDLSWPIWTGSPVIGGFVPRCAKGVCR